MLKSINYYPIIVTVSDCNPFTNNLTLPYYFIGKNMLKNIEKLLLTMLFLLSFGANSFAQISQEKISGVVTDNDGMLLPGATVELISTVKKVTVCNEEGRFSFIGEFKRTDKIRVSYIGFITKTIVLADKRTFTIRLEEDSNLLNEVVVESHKSINDLDIRAKTGVIGEVDVKRLKDKPSINLAMALQGSSPGLVVTNTGELGSKPSVRIRGNASFRNGDRANEPLYVLDGKIISSEVFANLNPTDIGGIKVLKDAVACALYGIKAANGVIEITSLKGNPDGKINVVYDFNMGITTRGRRGIEMMGTSEKLELERLLKNSSAPGYRYSRDYYEDFHSTAPDKEQLIAEGETILNRLREVETDWFNELIRPNIYQKHGVSIKGGNEKTSFYASTSYSTQGGRIKGNSTSNISSRFSLDHVFSEKNFISISADGGYAKYDTPNSSSFSPSNLLYTLNPYETTDSKLYSFSNVGEGYTYNDIIKQYSKKSTDKRAGLNVMLSLQPITGLSVEAVMGIDFKVNESQSFVSASSFEERRSGAPEEHRGSITKGKDINTNISSNIRLTYNKVFKDIHDLTVGVNTDYLQRIEDNVYIKGYGVGNKNIPALINQSIEGNRKPSVSTLYERNIEFGFGAVGGYSYSGLLDLFTTFKADASSVLPSNKRWNYAWAVGGGVNLSNFNFMKNNKVISSLNIRGSYGQTANLLGVSPENTIATFAYSNGFYGKSRLLELQGYYNTDLVPEQTLNTDLGINIEIIKRFSLGVNLYQRTTKDALLNVPIPSSNGFRTMLRNIGVLENRGIENSLSIKVADTNDFRTNVRLTMVYNSNKVIELYSGKRLYTTEEAIVPDYEEGKPYDILWGLESLGINPIDGLPVFRAADGSEVNSTRLPKREDIISLGSATPPINGTVNISAAYKNIELDLDFYYVFGGVKKYNLTYIRNHTNSFKNAPKGQIENMWLKRGDTNKIYYSPFYSSSSLSTLFEYPNMRTVGKSDFIRLSMLSLRYRIPHKWIVNKTKGVIQYANFGIQASNLFTITPYKESDPETGTIAGTLQPVITLNANVTF